MESPWQDLLDRFMAQHPDVPGALLHVDTPRTRWSGAAGVSNVASSEPVEPDATFRVASVTKTYVAAAVLRLNEDREVGLDDSVGGYLGHELRELLGPHRCENILLRHLLTHTSGLCDFVNDTPYEQLIFSNLEREWTREDQVRLALEGCADVGAPGELFHYSDTGYVLLGAVIERATGTGLAEGLRALLRFDALGLNATYLERLEQPPSTANPRVSQYSGGVDTSAANPTFDLWGGGGLVSTTLDVAAFYRALFEGRVYKRPETLAQMIEPAVVEDGARVGMGIAGRTMAGYLAYGHGGHWGIYGGYVPDLDTALSVAALEANARGAVAEELVPAIVTAAASLASH